MPDPKSKTPWPFRWQLLPRPNEQSAVALMWLVCAVGIVFYFVSRTYTHGRLIEIEQAPAQHARYLVDINVAEWPELANLPGIGESLAKAIVEFRVTNGKFVRHEQLQEVPGIGDSKYKNLQAYLAPLPPTLR